MANSHAPGFRDDLSDIPNHRAGRADHLVTLAKGQSLTDGGLRTAALLQEALTAAPDHHEAHVLRDRLHQMLVPRWHFPMLADTGRNRAYARAIAQTVRPGDVVLDIGCGAGLTAMLAARAGAAHVYTCEQQPLIAEAARRVIAANGLSDRITVIAKPSHQLDVGTDLPEPADVLISEIVDTVLLGEGALATLVDAMGRLVKPDARAIPQHGRLRAQPVESEALAALWRPQEAEGFDLVAFHPFATVARVTPNDLAACPMRALGPATDLFKLDLARPGLRHGAVTKDLPLFESGTVQAVLVFFEMRLARGVTLSNGLTAEGHWGRTAFLLDHWLNAEAGDRLRITAQHDCEDLSLVPQGLVTSAEAADFAHPWIASGAALADLRAS